MEINQKMAVTRNPAAKLACKVALEKKSNLFLGLDVSDKSEFTRLLELCSSEIAGIKTHVDIIEGFSMDWWQTVLDSCKDNGLVVFEDRKFADIGTTVRMQYSSGIYRICDWANLVTVHSVAGPGSIQGLQKASQDCRTAIPRGALILAQMTSAGNLATADYTHKTVEFAKQHSEFAAGFIGNPSDPAGLRHLAKECLDGMLLFTPGINVDGGPGSLGQRYCTPKQAVDNGADFLIVASGICKSADPGRAAREYKIQGWRQD
jgi:orotidine 5'-phosphate decarboxylase subfamily 1